MTADALNIIITIMGATTTMVVVSEGDRKTCNRYKLRKRGMRSIMTISEWIKSWIIFDIDLRLTSGRHRPNQSQKNNRTRSCRKYLTPNRREHIVYIGNKFPRHRLLPNIICTAFPSLSPDKNSDIRSRPQNFPVGSDSFTIGIDNHDSTTISNGSSHFIGVITQVKGKTVKGFGGMIQVKGKGAIVWKIIR